MGNGNIRKKPIGAVLVEKGIITPEQLQRVLQEHKKKGGHFCNLVVKSGFAPQNLVFKALSEQLGVQYVDLKTTEIDLRALKKVPVKLAFSYKLMPYKLESNRLVVAMADPLNILVLDNLNMLLNTRVEAVLSYEEDIIASIKKNYGIGADILGGVMTMTQKDSRGVAEQKSPHVDELRAAAENATVIKLVNYIFTQAVEKRATDIHIEPFENELRVRLRIDGFLYDVPISESIEVFHAAIISRIKVISGLDIAERRLFQDGRTKIEASGEEVDLRVSVMPTSFGESVQIRILRPLSVLELGDLGLLGDDIKTIKELINRPYGIIFVTGPTGSGKTTTLYAFLGEKNHPEVKIITLEDPVEYRIKGITQIQINPVIGATFAKGLRAIFRHDPDIIMLGEVRDVESAEIAIRSAMTGHLVFSTLHTNDAAGAPARLIEMGIEPFLISTSLQGVVAQRLVRKLCLKCKEKVPVSSKMFKTEGLDIKEDVLEIFESRKCEDCRSIGYKDRTAIFEILPINEGVKEAILEKAGSDTIKQRAASTGMHSLRQDGLRKVLRGITTLDEVMRVTLAV